MFYTQRFWVSSEFEFGKRTYDIFDDEDDVESIFSDYHFIRVNFFGSLRIWDGISLNGFATHEPQNHERPGDDTSITLFSLDLSYRF